MAFPVPPDEVALHARVLAKDPVSSAEAFERLMAPLISALRRYIPCTEDEAHDSAVDAVFAYLDKPEKFDRSKGRLCTFLTDIAKKKALDRLRARRSAARREGSYAELVELRRTDPKDTMEVGIEAKQLWEKIEREVPHRDRRVLGLILSGERETEVLAEALGLTGIPAGEQRRQVKQHRDRLLKVLERLGARLGHDEGT